MRNTLGDALNEYALVYIDDIIIFSDTFEEHLIHVQKVFDKLKEKNWKVAKEKAHFCLSQVKLLQNQVVLTLLGSS